MVKHAANDGELLLTASERVQRAFTKMTAEHTLVECNDVQRRTSLAIPTAAAIVNTVPAASYPPSLLRSTTTAPRMWPKPRRAHSSHGVCARG